MKGVNISCCRIGGATGKPPRMNCEKLTAADSRQAAVSSARNGGFNV